MNHIEKDLKDTLSMKETEISSNSSNSIDTAKYDKTIFTSYENITILFTIFKHIILICDQPALEFLVSDQIYLITFGALEHDYDSISSHKFIRHRQFFNEKLKFKNPFKIEDAKILEKIHINYRLIYLRDIAIGRFIEESTMKTISIITNSNFGDIISYIANNKYVLKNVVEKLNSNDLNNKIEAVEFVVEAINICKEM